MAKWPKNESDLRIKKATPLFNTQYLFCLLSLIYASASSHSWALAEPSAQKPTPSPSIFIIPKGEAICAAVADTYGTQHISQA